MKKLVLLAALFITTSAYSKKVKFAVDMTGQIINVTGIHVAGDFQTLAGFPGGDWASNTTTLTQEGSTDIYSIVVDIPAFAKYEYKFINGDQFYEAEFVPEYSRVGYNFNDNRWLYVDSLADDTTFIGAILFGGNAPAGQLLLRTLVDVSSIMPVSTAGIHVAGTFQGWSPTATIMYSFGSNVYEVISYAVAGTFEYKFYNGNTINDAEVITGACTINSNRTIVLAADTILPTMCYGSCSVCVASVAETNPSTFSVFPNPSENQTCISFRENGLRQVRISDATGKLIRSYNSVYGDKLIVSKDALSSGLYIIQVTDGSSFSTGKLIFK